MNSEVLYILTDLSSGRPSIMERAMAADSRVERLASFGCVRITYSLKPVLLNFT